VSRQPGAQVQVGQAAGRDETRFQAGLAGMLHAKHRLAGQEHDVEQATARSWLAARRLLVTRLALKRDAAMSTGLSTSLIAGGALTAFTYLVTRPVLLPHSTVAAAVVPLSTAVILLGALSMVVRRHTVAQLIGWLIVENGVFLGAITLVATFPFIVEAGIFLDIVAGVLIMVVFVSGLTRQLAEASAVELRELRG
jgi:hydrogenase-4 component E